MRMIGHLANEPAARTFSDYLYVKGIKNQVEAESDGTWALWIHAEDEIEQARKLLQTFLANPHDPVVHRQAEKARELISREKEEEVETKKRYFDRDRLFTRGWFGMGALTLILISISVIIYLLQEYTSYHWIVSYLLISLDGMSKGLPEVREGQVWRLLTPIFLHANVWHILFNMLWLNDLGTMIESRRGTLEFGLLVLVIGVTSNLGQYYADGPGFGGMSGVVYGLLGYIWMKSRFDPGSGLFLHQSTVMMMLIWLVLGYTRLLPFSMANGAHTVGLVVGVVWGFVSARWR